MTRAFLIATAAALLGTSLSMSPAPAGAGGAMDKQIRMMFEKFDKDGDGRICAEEFEDVHMIRFYTLDMDNDGEISREEFVFMQGMRGEPAGRAHQAFNGLDTDRNGRLSVEEFDASRAPSFATLDMNMDGTLSTSEVSEVASAKVASRSQ